MPADTKSLKLQNYIGGKWVESAASECLDVTNPATGEILATVPLTPPEEVDRAAHSPGPR